MSASHLVDSLETLIARAVEAEAAMRPLDRALMKADQRRSFVRGQVGFDPPPHLVPDGYLADEVRRLQSRLDKALNALRLSRVWVAAAAEGAGSEAREAKEDPEMLESALREPQP